MAALLNPGQMGRQRRMRLFFFYIVEIHPPFPLTPFLPRLGILRPEGERRSANGEDSTRGNIRETSEASSK